MRDYSAIYHLITLGNIISEYRYSLTELKKFTLNNRTNDYLFHALSSQTIILTNSFLEEYDVFFKSSDKDFNEKILMVKSIVKPAISKIRGWSGIKDFRNNVLCHNLRKDKKSVFIGAEIHNYNIPNDVMELQTLMGCIIIVNDVIKKVFEKENEEFLLNNPKVNSKPNFKVSINLSIKELEKIYEDVELNMPPVRPKL